MGKECKEKIKCLHSSEAISMLLSNAPHRLTISEIAETTNYHRNTISTALHKMVDEDKVQIMYEDSRISYYYLDTVCDHYRRVGKSLFDLKIPGLDPMTKRKILRGMSKNMVETALEEVVCNISEEFCHSNWIEALIHIKMAYPFVDVNLKKNNDSPDPVKFSIEEEKFLDGTYDQTDFALRVHPCLCQDKPNQDYACDMVEGAIEGAISAACGIEATVKKNGSGSNSKHGAYCSYRIKSSGFDKQSKTTEKIKTKA